MVEPNGVTVLLLEDDDDFRESLIDGLESYGFNVAAAAHIDAIHQQHLLDHASIAVLDLMLEREQSSSLVRYIKVHPRHKDLQIIMISGYDHASKRALMWGADHFLKKPFKVADLVDKIDAVLGIAREH
ncbi:MAG: response regulator transcription factor [Anaerolineae bacterium]|nr:response regulator transcription factor [Anaerolineae bacterium]